METVCFSLWSLKPWPSNSESCAPPNELIGWLVMCTKHVPNSFGDFSLQTCDSSNGCKDSSRYQKTHIHKYIHKCLNLIRAQIVAQCVKCFYWCILNIIIRYYNVIVAPWIRYIHRCAYTPWFNIRYIHLMCLNPRGINQVHSQCI